jgi:hypothetical protein
MRGPAKFKGTEVTRAAKAVIAAGLPVARIEITLDGSIVVYPGKPSEMIGHIHEETNEWDDPT